LIEAGVPTDLYGGPVSRRSNTLISQPMLLQAVYVQNIAIVTALVAKNASLLVSTRMGASGEPTAANEMLGATLSGKTALHVAVAYDAKLVTYTRDHLKVSRLQVLSVQTVLYVHRHIVWLFLYTYRRHFVLYHLKRGHSSDKIIALLSKLAEDSSVDLKKISMHGRGEGTAAFDDEIERVQAALQRITERRAWLKGEGEERKERQEREGGAEDEGRVIGEFLVRDTQVLVNVEATRYILALLESPQITDGSLNAHITAAADVVLAAAVAAASAALAAAAASAASAASANEEGEVGAGRTITSINVHCTHTL
jgi:hypothetical protein